MTQKDLSNKQDQPQELATVKRDISAQVLAKVDTFQRTGELRLPKDYSPENALKSAYIILSDPKNNLLAKCTKESVATALLKMVTWGLSPLKSQCYFIPFGDKLECTPDYSGNIALAKRYGGLKTIKANAIFEGDEFEFEVGMDGRRKVIKHKQTLGSIDSPVVGAYAVYELEDGTTDTEVMSIDMIHKAWGQGATKGNSPAHRNFADQMACKTVINRACKLLIRSSSDAVLMGADSDTETEAPNRYAKEVELEANQGDIIDIPTEEVASEPATDEPAPADSPEPMANSQEPIANTEVPF